MPHENVVEDKEIYQPDNEFPPRKRRVRLRLAVKTLEPDSLTYKNCTTCGARSYDKPFCIEHLDRLPYIQDLKLRLE